MRELPAVRRTQSIALGQNFFDIPYPIATYLGYTAMFLMELVMDWPAATGANRITKLNRFTIWNNNTSDTIYIIFIYSKQNNDIVFSGGGCAALRFWVKGGGGKSPAALPWIHHCPV